MWEFTIFGVDLYHIIQWLILYSFLGWVWETSYVSVKNRRFVNRGFVNGPFCTIYGFGALSVYFILRPVSGNWALLYVGGVVVATVLEYLTAVLMESIFHTSWWDYSDKKFNFQGRICLAASLAWGGFTLLLFWVLQPFVEWVVSLYSQRAGRIASTVLLLYYAADFTASAVTAFGMSARFRSLETQLEEKRRELMEQFQKVRDLEPGQLVENAGEKLEKLRDNLTESLTERFGPLEEQQFIKAAEELKEQWSQRQSFMARRYLKAYPHLNRGYWIRHKKQKNKKKKTGGDSPAA